MADCDITAGIGKVCKGNLGGNKKIYIINDIADPFTIVDGVITGINPLITEVFEFDITGDGNTLEESMASDRNAFTTVNTQTLTALLGKMDVTKNVTLNSLTYGFPISVVVDRNDAYKGVGIDDGIDFTVVGSSGGAKADFNGYTLTGVSTTGALAPILDEATVTALKALVVVN